MNDVQVPLLVKLYRFGLWGKSHEFAVELFGMFAGKFPKSRKINSYNERNQA
jgi:hypothetical protein